MCMLFVQPCMFYSMSGFFFAALIIFDNLSLCKARTTAAAAGAPMQQAGAKSKLVLVLGRALTLTAIVF